MSMSMYRWPRRAWKILSRKMFWSRISTSLIRKIIFINSYLNTLVDFCTSWADQGKLLHISAVANAISQYFGLPPAKPSCTQGSYDSGIMRSVCCYSLERQEATDVLVVHVDGIVLADVRRKDGTVATVQLVALLSRPVLQFVLSVEPVDESVLGDISSSRKHGHNVFRCSIFL